MPLFLKRLWVSFDDFKQISALKYKAIVKTKFISNISTEVEFTHLLAYCSDKHSRYMLRYNDGTFYNKKPLSDLIRPSHDRPEEGRSDETSPNMGRGVDRNQRRSGYNKPVFLFTLLPNRKEKFGPGMVG